MVKNWVTKLIPGTVLLLASLSFSAAAQDTFTITGANPNGFSNGGVYVSPYTATITNPNTNSTVLSGEVICDDYTDEVSLGESWTVTSSPASSVSGQLFTTPVTWNHVMYSNQQAYD